MTESSTMEQCFDKHSDDGGLLDACLRAADGGLWDAIGYQLDRLPEIAQFGVFVGAIAILPAIGMALFEWLFGRP